MSWSFVSAAVRRRVRAAIFLRDGYRCQVRLTGCTGGAEEVDHIVPIEHGGAVLDPTNLRTSCAWCNDHRKNRQPLRAW